MVGDGAYLSTGEAAKVIGVSKSLVVKLLNTGQLAYATLPGSTHRRILRSVAEAMRDKMVRDAAGETGPTVTDNPET